ncbi:hypothetical protein ABZW47_29460 [Streptomyces sp. NPDC004549]|uniref:hypothetical protein n=1 Tax=Streptomyces sp. NPDC004549 TaxID=3154283 RepID=UPI0033A506E3
MHNVEDLVEQVLGPSPLPRSGNGVRLLLAGLRRHLPRLEQLLKDTSPDLVRQARRIREERLPEGHMPLVILTIRLAEIAQALLDAVPADAVCKRGPNLSTRRAVGSSDEDAGSVLDRTEQVSASLPNFTAVAEADRAGALHRELVPMAVSVSAAVGFLCGCGPPG